MRLRELVVARSGGRADVTIPGGTLSDRCARELVAAFDSFDDDDQLRVVVLRSEGRDFCTGPADDLARTAPGVTPAEAIAACRVPVICALTGNVESVGLEVALACDLRLAGSGAQFALADVLVGRLPSWGGTQRLPRAVGIGLATQMLLLGTRLDAMRASDVGLVHEVADPVEVLVDQWASELLALAPLALALAKEAVHRGVEMPMRQALELEGDLNHLLQTTSDRSEGLQAFFEKRPPHFEGR